MPVYEYHCTACGQDFEYEHRMSDPRKTVCEACGGALERLISRTSFSFKGGGWYKDLYASSTPGAASGDGGGATTSGDGATSGGGAGGAGGAGGTGGTGGTGGSSGGSGGGSGDGGGSSGGTSTPAKPGGSSTAAAAS